MILKGQIIEIDRTAEIPNFFILQIADYQTKIGYFNEIFEKLAKDAPEGTRFVIPLKNDELKIRTKIDIKNMMGCYVRATISIQKFEFNNIKGYKVHLIKIDEDKRICQL